MEGRVPSKNMQADLKTHGEITNMTTTGTL